MRIQHFIFMCAVCMGMLDFSVWAKQNNFSKQAETFRTIHFVNHKKSQLNLIQSWILIYSVNKQFDLIEMEDNNIYIQPRIHLNNQTQSTNTCDQQENQRLFFGDKTASDYWKVQDASGVFSIKHLW